MTADQPLHDIINELPISFINRVNAQTDIVQLRKLLELYHCYNRRAVIRARIDHLAPLVI